MDFAADLSLMYADFGINAIHRAASDGAETIGRAILDAPGINLIGDDVLGTNYTLRYPLTTFPDVRRGDAFMLAETLYTVREGPTPASAVNWTATATLIDAPIPRNKWFRLRVIVKRHATAGEVTVLIDNKVALRVVGVPTIKDAASDLYTIRAGITLNGGGVGFVDVDNLIVEVDAAPPVRIEAGTVS
jgi:hypothetical protein